MHVDDLSIRPCTVERLQLDDAPALLKQIDQSTCWPILASAAPTELRDARDLPISTKSLGFYERFAAETGGNTGFRRCGRLYLFNNEAGIDGWARWHDFARTVGMTTHMLSPTEAIEKGRATSRSRKDGVFSATDGITDPASAAPAVARAIIKLGGDVIQNCAARGVETQAGRLSIVITQGGTIPTKKRRSLPASVGLVLLPAIGDPLSPGIDPRPSSPFPAVRRAFCLHSTRQESLSPPAVMAAIRVPSADAGVSMSR